MSSDDLLTAISALAKLVPEDAVETALRRAIADLGAQVGASRTAQTPAKKSVAPSADRQLAVKRVVDIPAAMMAWLEGASPAKIAAEIGVERTAIYDWRNNGRVSAKTYGSLEALMNSGKDVSGTKRAATATATATATAIVDDRAALELEIAARCAADGMTRAEIFELCAVTGTDDPQDRAKIAETLAAL